MGGSPNIPLPVHSLSRLKAATPKQHNNGRQNKQPALSLFCTLLHLTIIIPRHPPLPLRQPSTSTNDRTIRGGNRQCWSRRCDCRSQQEHPFQPSQLSSYRTDHG